MTGLQLAYAAPLALSVLASALVLALVWRRRASSAAVQAFANSVLGQTLWGLGYLGELFSDGLREKVLWDLFQVLPSYVAGLEALRFSLVFTGNKLLESRRALATLWALPLLHTLVLLTSPWHHAGYSDAHVVEQEPFDALLYSFTPFDQFAYGYLLVLGVVGPVALFGRVLLSRSHALRAQLLPVGIALALPLVSTLLLIFGVKLLGQRDTSPYAFAVSSFIVAHSLLRRRLFELNPIAYQAVIAAAPDAVLVIDEAEVVVDANPALGRLLGDDRTLAGEPLKDAIPWALPALSTSPWQPFDIELSEDCILEARSAPLEGRKGRVVGRVLTFRDVTLTRRAARVLKQQNEELERRVNERTLALEVSRKQLRDVLDQAFQLMGILELDGTLVHANRAALEMVGAKANEVVGKKFWETPWWAHSAEERAQVREAIARAGGGELVRFSTTHRDSRGELRTIDFSIKPVLDEQGRAVVLVPEGRDVTELRRADEQRRTLELQLMQAQKVESLGRLAGGVAHDFNNLLTAILGNVELARMDLPTGRPIDEYLDDVVHASESAKALVQQLLVFTRKPSAEVASVDLVATVETTARMLARLLGEDVRIALDLPKEKVHVRMDPRQAEQVLVNLAVNARDAMPDGGTLSIRLDPYGETGGRRVRLSVTDTGSGMSKQVQARIFEPFFTTKPVGKGTGLGLALVFEVVRQAGGDIDVESELGRGTTFSIDLPEVGAEGKAVSSATKLALPGGRETILLVEDQLELARFTQGMLRRLGYTVFPFRTGEELLQALDSIPRADLLFTDVVLPGIGGPALADRLVVAQPWLRVLFASGYHEESLSQRSNTPARSRLLAKPFSSDDLAHAVRQALDSSVS